MRSTVSHVANAAIRNGTSHWQRIYHVDELVAKMRSYLDDVVIVLLQRYIPVIMERNFNLPKPCVDDLLLH